MFLLWDFGRDGYMYYKKEIIEMIEKMSNLTFLKMAYGFVRRLYKEEKEQGS
jgi:hypothetical protein